MSNQSLLQRYKRMINYRIDKLQTELSPRLEGKPERVRQWIIERETDRIIKEVEAKLGIAP